ncbi:MAG: transposase [Bdellovibrionales bacterium]|nr:transposase [Bdellovibrionales bacterium]
MESTETLPLELDRLVDSHHPLVLLSEEIDWKGFEHVLLAPGERKSADLRLTLRTMLALNYLKQKYQLNDIEVIRKTQTNPYWQHFCGMTHFTRTPITTPTKMEQWRQRLHSALKTVEAKTSFRTDLSADLFSSELFASQLLEAPENTAAKVSI